MKKFWINLGVSLVIGGLFIWLAISNDNLNWSVVKEAITQVDWRILFFYFLLLALIQLVRIVRWGILLKPLGEISFVRLFSVGSVGIMALMLLPLRLGEFARPILISEPGKIRISAALGTIVAERVVDSLAMASLLASIMYFLPEKMNMEINLRFWSLVILAGCVFALLFLVVAYKNRTAALTLVRKISKPFPKKFSEKLTSFADSFISGLQALPNLKLLLVFLLLTTAYWLLAGFGMYYMFTAFSELNHLGLLEAFAVLSVLCVGLMIPAGPGMVGNFHYFVTLGLSLFLTNQMAGSAGMAYAIVVHAMQLLQQLVFGLPFLFSGHLSFRRLLSASDRIGKGLDKVGNS